MNLSSKVFIQTDLPFRKGSSTTSKSIHFFFDYHTSLVYFTTQFSFFIFELWFSFILFKRSHNFTLFFMGIDLLALVYPRGHVALGCSKNIRPLPVPCGTCIGHFYER